MKKLHLFLSLALAACLLLGACSTASQSAPRPADADLIERERTGQDMGGELADGGAPEYAASAQSMPMAPDGAPPSAGLPGSFDGGEVKMIYQADITLQTVDFPASVSALEDLAQELGGYFESSSTKGGGYYETERGQRYGQYTIRVPGAAFQSFLSRAGEAGYVVSSSSYATDIGAEYRDAEMRLATLETKQERLLSLLEKAGLMEDIIQLENALSDTQYQIDQYASTLKRYDALVSFSTIRVSLTEVLRIEDEPGQKADLLTRLGAALTGGLSGFGQGAADLAVAVVYRLPVFLTWAVLLFAGMRLAMRVYRHRVGKRKGSGEE